MSETSAAKIKVIGIGGGGGNAVSYMATEGVQDVVFICSNTDIQALEQHRASTKGIEVCLQLGAECTRGLGAGANPEIGRKSAEEVREKIHDLLEGTDMVFLIVGMGGGTGTGAILTFAEVAKEKGILTVAVVTKPFVFEGRKRMVVAEEGIRALTHTVDSLIVLPNNRLLSVLGKNVELLTAFKHLDHFAYTVVKGISELITVGGQINVDFADVRSVMSETGMAIMGTGGGTGDNRARSAAEAAIFSPYLQDTDFADARGVLVNITAGLDMSIGEFEQVGEVIKAFASEDATVIIGAVIDPEMAEELRVTVVITGLGRERAGSSASDSDEKNARIASLKAAENSPKNADRYQQLDRPTYIRQQEAKKEPAFAEETTSREEKGFESFNIPAFLKREDSD